MEDYTKVAYKEAGNKKIKFARKEIHYFKKTDEIKKKTIGYVVDNNKEYKDTIGLLTGITKNRDLYITKKKHSKVTGYVQIEDGRYVGICKHSLIALILFWIGAAILAFILGILIISLITKKPARELLPIDPGEIFDDLGGNGAKDVQEILKDDPGIDFPIYSLKEFIVTDDAPNINLGNPDTNIILFQYVVTENGKEIYKTNLIEPGKAVAWNAKKALSNGTHSLNLETKTYTKESQTETNGFQTTMKVTVK